MKKIIAKLFALTLSVALVGCQGTTGSSTSPAASAAPAPQNAASISSANPPPAAAYPEKAITVICCYQAGSNQDLSTRAIVGAMEKTLGVPFVVENVVGADGVTGHIKLAAAANDGYTIGITSASPLCVSPYMQNEIPYSYESFEYIGMFLPYMHGFAVSSSSSIQDLNGLIDWAKADKRICGYAGTVNLINVMKLMEMGGVETQNITFVPYNSNEVMPALAGGFIDFTCHASSTITPMVEAGNIRLIGPLGDQRWDCSPDVKTSLEQGYELYSFGGLGLSTPKGVDENQLKVLRDAFDKALQDQAFLNYVDTIGYNKYFQNGQEYYESTAENAKLAQEYLKELGLAVN